jgi:hypothetical protein
MMDATNLNKKLIKAWSKASEELGIQIETPFILKIENVEIEFGLHIKNFGSELGILIFTIDNMSGFDKAKECGFYCSALNPFRYENYDRENFIETLTDWGYFGHESGKPEWYNGHIYWNDK